jgi:hypothetical protein
MERIQSKNNDVATLFDVYYNKIKKSDYDDYKIPYVLHKLQTICKVTNSDDILKLIVEYANRYEIHEEPIHQEIYRIRSPEKIKEVSNKISENSNTISEFSSNKIQSPLKINNDNINYSVVRTKTKHNENLPSFSLNPESIMIIKRNMLSQKVNTQKHQDYTLSESTKINKDLTDSPLSPLKVSSPNIINSSIKNLNVITPSSAINNGSPKYTFGIEGKRPLLPYNLESANNTINFNLYNLPYPLRIMIYEYIKVVEKNVEFEIQKDMYKSWVGSRIQNN